jgi:hypothetical protein
VVLAASVAAEDAICTRALDGVHDNVIVPARGARSSTRWCAAMSR